MRIWFGNAVLVIIVAVLLYFFGFQHVRFYKVAASSMEPTLKTGDRTIAIRPIKIVRKDIVILKDPRGGTDILVKRIIGLPGEMIKTRKKVIYINGKKLDEPYVKEALIEPILYTVPQNSYFVLGDNRNISDDSSEWGSINSELITGKVIYRY